MRTPGVIRPWGLLVGVWVPVPGGSAWLVRSGGRRGEPARGGGRPGCGVRQLQYPRPVPRQLRPGRAGRGHPDRAALRDAWPAALTTYLGRQIRLASSQVTARHPDHEEAAALALPSDAAVLVREDIYEDRRGTLVDFTRTVWPGDTTRLVVGG